MGAAKRGISWQSRLLFDENNDRVCAATVVRCKRRLYELKEAHLRNLRSWVRKVVNGLLVRAQWRWSVTRRELAALVDNVN